MKAEHRHELKTNELADWIAHLPEWAARNRNAILGVTAAVILLIAAWIWYVNFYKAGQIEERLALTTAVMEVTEKKAMIASSTGTDMSIQLGLTADNLKTLADAETNPNMAAFAHIKRGEAIRSEIHFRLSPQTNVERQAQLQQAQDAYDAALASQPTLPALTGAAKFGLGLCAEELGDVAQAKKIYQEITDDPALAGTIAVDSAATRLLAIDEFIQPVTFQPSPAPLIEIPTIDPNAATAPTVSIGDPNAASAPAITIRPADPNLVTPPVIIQPADANTAAPTVTIDANVPPIEVNVPTAPVIEANIPAPAEANKPAPTVAEPNRIPR